MPEVLSPHMPDQDSQALPVWHNAPHSSVYTGTAGIKITQGSSCQVVRGGEHIRSAEAVPRIMPDMRELTRTIDGLHHLVSNKMMPRVDELYRRSAVLRRAAGPKAPKTPQGPTNRFMKWAVRFENGQLHRYSAEQMREKFGVDNASFGMKVTHATRGCGTVFEETVPTLDDDMQVEQ